VHPPRFTILTPSYNRKTFLPRLAASLEAQSCRDFEWLVVDDGSTDGSAEYLEMKAGAWTFPLRVLRGPNGGKHRALNRGIPESRGAWIFIVDSDDALPPEALANLIPLTEAAWADPQACGVMGLRQHFGGSIIGESLPVHKGPRDAATLTFVDRIRGDKAEVYKTAVLEQFPFPEFKGEYFITECVVWYRMAAAGFHLHTTNEVLYLCDYLADGLSARSFDLRIRNPEGTLLFYRETLALNFPSHRLAREAVNWLRFARHARRLRACLGSIPRRRALLVTVSLPIAIVAACMDRLRHPQSFR
jgi:glycosyltransferase involved in cell wall biosynthesis